MQPDAATAYVYWDLDGYVWARAGAETIGPCGSEAEARSLAAEALAEADLADLEHESALRRRSDALASAMVRGCCGWGERGG